MATVIPFFDKASHQVEKLRANFPSQPRLAAMQLALWSTGKALSGKIIGEFFSVPTRRDDNVLHLAFLLRGGIGDIILNLAWIDALVFLADCPCHVDIYTNTSEVCMKALCRSCHYVNHLHSLKTHIPFSSFDVVFDIMQLPQVKACCEERLTNLSLALGDYVRRLLNFQTSHASFYLDENQAMGIHYADVMGTFRRGQADFDGSLGLKDSSFTLQPDISLEDVSQRFSLRPGYVTIQREAGASAQSLKLWSSVKYSALLEALYQEFPSMQIVLLGVEKNFDAPESEQVVDLRGRTCFDEFMTLVRHARLHIGCEGVVPHLRHYLHGGPSLVLYGPSCSRMLSYPENISLSGTECPNGCEGIIPSWQKICLKGYKCCNSLDEITVDQVMQQIRNFFNKI